MKFFSEKLERTSFFIPEYMDDILIMIARKEGRGKSAFIREAILRAIEEYKLELDKVPSRTNDHGPIDKSGRFFGKHLDKAKSLSRKKRQFESFGEHGEKFPQAVRLNEK